MHDFLIQLFIYLQCIPVFYSLYEYRMWDIDREENFILNLEGGVGYPTSDLLMCISYSTQKGNG